MNPSSSARQRLGLLLPQWQGLLQGWAASGELVAAAREALRLEGESARLSALVGQWAAGEFSALPSIELLPASAMPGAAGAYAISTGTIYLNADWLAQATAEQAIAVLSEELGHHLDGLVNGLETPGDEGELFAALLRGGGVISAQQRQRLLSDNDQGIVLVNGEGLAMEKATISSTPIRASSPGRTSGEVRNTSAFAALKADGSVVTWGGTGGDSSAVATRLASGVSQIFSTAYAFAALKADGSVVSWGDSRFGGDSSAVAARLASGVSQIFSTGGAFAALKADGSVVTWGGTGGDSSAVAARLASGVSQIFSTSRAFAALKADSSVVTWGGRWGDSSAVAAYLTSGVSQIFSTDSAFAALMADGSVVTWGDRYSGGDSSAVAARLASGVSQIFSTDSAFAALKADSSVVTWGDPGSRYGNNGGDSSAVAARLASGVSQIFSTGGAFAALMADGSVVTWGDSNRGGDSSAVAARLASGVSQIFSTGGAFAALMADGSVVTWGSSEWGGDSSSKPVSLASGVSQIFSTGGAFAALKADGSVVTWGDSNRGGDSSAVAARLASGVSQIFSTDSAFAALMADGSVVTWGDPGGGGDSRAAAARLRSGVVGFANPFTDDRLLVFDSLPAWVTLTVSPASAREGGLNSLIYTFIRTGMTTSALTVNYTVSGTATLGADYTGIAATGTVETVTFAPGSATATVTITPTDDTILEDDETVVLSLVNGSDYNIETTEAVVGTIVNVGPPTITLVASPALVIEGGGANLIYTFSRTEATTSALTVNYTVSGTATLGADYTGIAAAGTIKTVTIAPGSATATVTVTPTDDTILEDDETVVLSLVNGSDYNIETTAAVVGTIRSSALPVISLAVSPASATENGTANLIYTFTRNGGTTAALSVNYTVAGTATLGSDYTGIATAGTTKTVSFAAGSATATVTVDPATDSSSEGNETVALTLAAGSGYAIGTTAAVVGTISDSVLPVISLAVSPASVTEDGTANLIYTFTRSGPTTAALSVNYRAAGTATLGSDYTGIATAGTTKTASFAAGSATAAVTVNPKADTRRERNETVALTLAAGSGYAIGTTAAVVGTIRNDDIRASLSTTLAADQSNLTLTGTQRINGTGNNLNNAIIGNASNNRITGGLGKDTLTGGGATDSDTFAYQALDESLLQSFDVITDYKGRDRILVPSSLETATIDASIGNATSLTAAAIAGVLSTTAFAANRARAFTATGYAGTFLAFNDGRAGYQASTDSVIFLRGFAFSSTSYVDLI